VKLELGSSGRDTRQRYRELGRYCLRVRAYFAILLDHPIDIDSTTDYDANVFRQGTLSAEHSLGTVEVHLCKAVVLLFQLVTVKIIALWKDAFQQMPEVSFREEAGPGFIAHHELAVDSAWQAHKYGGVC